MSGDSARLGPTPPPEGPAGARAVEDALGDGLVARTAEPSEVLRTAADLTERGVRAALATVLARRGSAPSSPGQKLVLFEEQGRLQAVGTIGGGAIELSVIRELRAHLRGDTEAKVHTFRLGPELGMCCGGQADVLLEPLVAATPALVVGGGHIGALVAPLLAQCGFRVVLCDDRDGVVDEAASEPRLRRVQGDFVFAGHGLPRTAAVLAMTHDHQLDQRVVEWALREGFAFVGGVGSRAKAARTRQRLEQKGFPPADVERVHMPLGVDIGARAPAEIAVSIVAALIAFRRDPPASRRGGLP